MDLSSHWCKASPSVLRHHGPGPAQPHSVQGQDRAAGQLGPSLVPWPDPTQGLSVAGRRARIRINSYKDSCLPSLACLSFSSAMCHPICPPSEPHHHTDPASLQYKPLFALIPHPLPQPQCRIHHRCSLLLQKLRHLWHRLQTASAGGSVCCLL